MLAVSGCWVGGEIRYRDHPELTKVTLATGERKMVGATRGTGGDVAMHVAVGAIIFGS